LILGLYRSWRALSVILACLGMAVLLGVAFAGLVGFGFTIVSSLVPLTLMITATASLVYLHSRFVDQDSGVSLDDHRVFALKNKFLAVSASVFAAAVGFAALTVSEIRPIRQLGMWTATGLAIGWVVCFTLYPALQVIFKTPTRQQRAVAGGWVIRAAEVLPRWSYSWRWALLTGSVVLAVAGLIALLGLPGLIAPMRLQVNALDYVDPDLPAARDTRAYTNRVLGLTSVSLWVTTPPGTVLDPLTLAAMDRLTDELKKEPAVGSVVGLPGVLRLRRYAAGQGDSLPRDEAELTRLSADLEQLILEEPTLQRFVDTASLGATYLTVTCRAGDSGGLAALTAAISAAWSRAGAAAPALTVFSYRIVGSGVLQANIAAHLVPTLTQSFSITFAIIFVTFILVFKSGPARLTAMVPSLFAILVMFLGMRIFGIPLNVATILIATTVLGATENDQIHFFYHFQERRNGATTEQALSHSIRVAGHAIVFATVINAGGFLALIMSNLPPMRQFGIVTSAAFALAMLADFTALPATLWILFRERPDELSQS
jgi:predicted RND superfamily exporter protein